MRGRTIRQFLIEGQMDGRWISELSNWSGKAIRDWFLANEFADFVDEDGFRIRKDESYEKNYLIAKYGAIPTLKSIDIFKEE